MRRIGQTSDFVESIWISGFPYDLHLDRILQTKDKRALTVLSKGKFVIVKFAALE